MQRNYSTLIAKKNTDVVRNKNFFQPKLTINQPNDVYEQEADPVADKVMRMEHSSIQAKLLPDIPMQCKEINDEEATADNKLENYIGNLSSGGQPLPGEVLNFYEPRFGRDFSNVKVHSDTVAAKSAASINALAYTSGNNIVFNNGQYAPNTDSGKRLLGHELTHVLQQGNTQQRIQKQSSCNNNSTPEAQFAATNPGKVFGSGDKNSEPNEFELWNYCVGETAMRSEHEAALLKEIPRWKTLMTGLRGDLKIKIQGTASQSGNVSSNEELAAKRAENVQLFLENNGIPKDRIIAAGIGSNQALADETTPANMARNRRVEVFFFTPTTTTTIPGSLVDAQVSNLAIGKQSVPVPPPDFDTKKNIFFRTNPAMIASADVVLTGFQGDSVGFLQFLIEDNRMAQYKSKQGQSKLLLDYGRCNTQLPCRDSLDGTSIFSIDNRSITLPKTGTTSGKVAISDRPGTGFPMIYTDSNGNIFELESYFWSMRFDLILGVRSMTGFMPLFSSLWGLAAAEDVDVPKKTTTGLGPVAVHSGFTATTAAAKRSVIDAAMAEKTCRLMARIRNIEQSDLPCQPVETSA
jgi:Domain of unknown function (DUF4157)/OmpA family